MSSLKRFSNTVETTASAEDIWAIWTNVERWPEWDSELVSACLDGAFALHATGHLVPKQGGRSRFVISQFADSGSPESRSYRLSVQLPLCKLHVRRFFEDALLEEAQDKLRFTHEVSFEGPSAFLFSALLGRRFRAVLPQVMQSIKVMAES